MQVEYTYVGPMRVLFARAYGPYSTSSRQAWSQLLEWLDGRNARRSIRRYVGIIPDNPRDIGPLQRRYDACVEVQTGIDVDLKACIGRQTISGGAYAIHHCTGPAHNVRLQFQKLHQEWVPADGLTVDRSRAFIEICHSDPTEVVGPERHYEICVPVVASGLSQIYRAAGLRLSA